jgi:hypothetical protein
MAGLIGIAPTARLFGADEPALSPELRALIEVAFVPAAHARATLTAQAGAFRQGAATPWSVTGRMAHRFVDDYYDRLHLTPRHLALGNVVSQIVREVAVWNAWRTRPATVTALVLDGGDGIGIAPDTVPVAFAPLQERIWTLTVATDGPPLIDARLAFVFASGEVWSLNLTGQRLQAWTLPPDWSEPVGETLAWLTDVQTTLAGAVVRTPLRDAPRRTWEFGVLADRTERRLVENALYDWSARTWALPVFVDTTHLRAPLAVGTTRIAIDTAGLDFVVGGLAMLWRDATTYELVEVADITEVAGERLRLELRAPTQAAWPVGTRLIPCRTARLGVAPELRRHSDRLVGTRLRFEATEPCDWPPLAPPARYRGFPVLEDRLDWSEAPTATFARRATVLDGEVGRTAVDDMSGLAWTTQSHAWRVFGRASRAAHRSLLYWLQGRAEALWLPTWTDDIELLEPIGENATTLVVAWAGIARSLRLQAGRRHLRIELIDGRIFYRAIEAADEIERQNGGRGERLRLDAALGLMVAPERVRLACWMALVTLAGDTVELQHHADSEGLMDCGVAFASVGEEEP